MSTVTAADNHFCLFDVDNVSFAISASRIREVTPRPSFAEVPCCCPVLAGLWHEGSEFLPIVRLPFQVNFHGNQQRQVLIIDGPQGHWGLLVDAVRTITQMDYSPNNDLGETEWSAVTLGMSTWEDRSVRVLQVDSLYRLIEQILKRDWQLRYAIDGDSNKSTTLGVVQ